MRLTRVLAYVVGFILWTVEHIQVRAAEEWEVVRSDAAGFKDGLNAPGLYVSPQNQLPAPDYAHVYQARVARAVKAREEGRLRWDGSAR